MVGLRKLPVVIPNGCEKGLEDKGRVIIQDTMMHDVHEMSYLICATVVVALLKALLVDCAAYHSRVNEQV